MDFLAEIYKKSGRLHHAYFVVGERDATHDALLSFLKNTVGLQISGNPDFLSLEFDTFTIDDGRKLAVSEARKDFGGGKKIFIIRANSITEEAQNALLKVFEEPAEGTHFFIISPQDILLPTLRSRLHILTYNGSLCNNEEVSHITKTVFVNREGERERSVFQMNVGERMALVKEITDGISDLDKTKQDAIALLNTIERELYDSGVTQHASGLSVCETARLSLYDRGAPVKMILEHVMLSI